MPLNSPTNDFGNTRESGTLYLVATPIGNMDDITLRAIKVLQEVDIIAAEDTRRTARLLAFHNINGRLISFHEHNERERTPGLIKQLCAGSSVALVSDAGTPSVSDPGYPLIQKAIASRIKVTPIPGVSAAITALCASGMPTDSFVFVGFLPKKQNKRRQQLERLAGYPETLILYESPRRITTLLGEIVGIMGDRYAVLGREMTKQHEEFIRGFLSDLQGELDRRPAVKGECTLLVTGRAKVEEVSLETVRRAIREGLKTDGVRPSGLSKEIAKKYGLPKKQVYEEALKLAGKGRGKHQG